MLDTLSSLERDILLLINGFHSAWGDCFMYYITGKIAWIPMYLAMAWVLYKNLKLNTFLLILVAIAATIALTDQVCSSLLRPIFMRLRPSNLDNPIHNYIHLIYDHRGGKYGMPSCHGANTIALFVWMFYLLRKRLVTIFVGFWVLLECYSRMYAGVHYPGDLLAGLLVGSIIAYLCILLTYYILFTHENWFKNKETILKHEFRGSSLIVWVGLATIALIGVWATISVL